MAAQIKVGEKVVGSIGRGRYGTRQVIGTYAGKAYGALVVKDKDGKEHRCWRIGRLKSIPNPPGSWFQAMSARLTARNPRRRTETVSRDVVMTWIGYPEKVRGDIIDKYRKAPPAADTVDLPCPRCHTLNPVGSRTVQLKCRKCGTELVKVRLST